MTSSYGDDVAAIIRLRSEYSWAYDNGDAATFGALFAEDGECNLGDWGVFAGPAAITAGIAGQLVAPDPAPACLHHATTPRIEVDGDSAEGTWYVTVYHQPREGDVHPVRFVGRYFDTYTRKPDGWKFASVRLDPYWFAGY
ncbi:nuclear transport factor 2 family protein [Nocardioides pelophilus]|uniref:nuclear transport factor 2 family protein n=1 Tax=Nocardioides pelophilus TaxID=2172019 RepID=UPI0015FFFE1F|nr:nuclear transport factor 2 family protein [Nocardioides pelophilus]